MARLILLDRDGVINFDSPDYIKTADQWRPIPGSLNAIATLRANGFMVAVCTNQAGIARGKLDESDLAGIHAKMDSALDALNTRLDGLTYCPHLPEDACECRKPQPGMLLKMMRQLSAGAKDTVFAQKADVLKSHLEELGVPHDVKVYDDAGHSYMSKHPKWMMALAPLTPLKAHYNEAAAEDSWRRMFAFFETHFADH